MNKQKTLYMIDDLFIEKVQKIALRLRDLTQIEEKGGTHYTGQDLNILERIQENIANETITEQDIFEVERLLFKFM